MCQLRLQIGGTKEIMLMMLTGCLNLIVLLHTESIHSLCLLFFYLFFQYPSLFALLVHSQHVLFPHLFEQFCSFHSFSSVSNGIGTLCHVERADGRNSEGRQQKTKGFQLHLYRKEEGQLMTGKEEKRKKEVMKRERKKEMMKRERRKKKKKQMMNMKKN